MAYQEFATKRNLMRTTLYDKHIAMNGKMVPFGGWEMPLSYSKVLAEHEAVRTSVGVFDVSHMNFAGALIYSKYLVKILKNYNLK